MYFRRLKSTCEPLLSYVLQYPTPIFSRAFPDVLLVPRAIFKGVQRRVASAKLLCIREPPRKSGHARTQASALKLARYARRTSKHHGCLPRACAVEGVRRRAGRCGQLRSAF